jgi:anti-anti-sigma regulatory factor
MTTALIDLKTVASDDRGLSIALAGELDFHTAAHVGPRLREFAESGHRRLVVDLRGLSF